VLHRALAAAGIVVLFGCPLACQPPANPAPPAQQAPPSSATDRVHVGPDSDPRAIEIAQSVVERMGGWAAFDAVRYVSWNFFGRRRHYWDRATGDLRLEFSSDDGRFLVLMNVDSKQGRAWKDDRPVEDPQELEALLGSAHQIWINDAYWMFMPYKMLDPGVTLKYAGEGETEEGHAADVLELTFGEGVGYTPQNRYDVLVGRESGLVEQWNFYEDAADAEPSFRLPWNGWERFGGILLATDHGRGADWGIAVYDDLPRSVFESSAPVGAAD